jgi:L-ascorbate metabolism protein UlaG (beta-lactamase superfamily)
MQQPDREIGKNLRFCFSARVLLRQGMKVIYYGHSCFLVKAGGKNLLFDPFVTKNDLAKNIDVQKVPADYILISHGHFDHVDDAIEIAKRTGATIISNFEITEWFCGEGIKKTHAMNHGGAYKFDFGRLKYMTAIHTSSMPDGSYGGNPGGFVLETKDGNFYYSGDTALTYDMRLIGESTKLDFAALCIGDNFTMGIEDAIKAADFVGVSKVLGVHYDTFPEIKIDHDEAKKKFQKAGKQLYLPKIGESVEV